MFQKQHFGIFDTFNKLNPLKISLALTQNLVKKTLKSQITKLFSKEEEREIEQKLLLVANHNDSDLECGHVRVVMMMMTCKHEDRRARLLRICLMDVMTGVLLIIPSTRLT